MYLRARRSPTLRTKLIKRRIKLKFPSMKKNSLGVRRAPFHRLRVNSSVPVAPTSVSFEADSNGPRGVVQTRWKKASRSRGETNDGRILCTEKEGKYNTARPMEQVSTRACRKNISAPRRPSRVASRSVSPRGELRRVTNGQGSRVVFVFLRRKLRVKNRVPGGD